MIHKIPVVLIDILRSYEAKQSVCARKWTLLTTLLPVIHSLRETVWSDIREQIILLNHFFFSFFFGELVESVREIRLKRLKQFVARAAQIYNQNHSIKTHFQTCLEMSQYGPIMLVLPTHLALLFLQKYTKIWKRFRLRPKTNKPIICTLTEHLNKGVRWRFYGLSLSM